MIIKSALISSHDSEVFLERMSVAINTFDTKRNNGKKWFDTISKIIFPHKKK